MFPIRRSIEGDASSGTRIPLRRPRPFVPLVSPLFVSPRSSMHLLDSYNFTVGLVLERLSPRSSSPPPPSSPRLAPLPRAPPCSALHKDQSIKNAALHEINPLRRLPLRPRPRPFFSLLQDLPPPSPPLALALFLLDFQLTSRLQILSRARASDQLPPRMRGECSRVARSLRRSREQIVEPEERLFFGAAGSRGSGTG